MSKIKNIQLSKPANNVQEEKKPVDLSKLANGAYLLNIVGGAFIKKDNEGLVVVSLRFDQPELNHVRLDVTLMKLNFGSIIVPGVNPSSLKPIIKDKT